MIGAVLPWKEQIFRLQFQFFSPCCGGIDYCNVTTPFLYEFIGAWKITSTSTEGQKLHQNLAPVLVIISGKSLVFSRKNITSTGFDRYCAPDASAPSSGNKWVSQFNFFQNVICNDFNIFLLRAAPPPSLNLGGGGKSSPWNPNFGTGSPCPTYQLWPFSSTKKIIPKCLLGSQSAIPLIGLLLSNTFFK